ncbi:MAG: hypothetical protein K0R51_79 [Cytophagaceae bacterium]|jgi:hypothetical protein|nr:hypothetical protein [Cytophagaceae bacterium]
MKKNVSLLLFALFIFTVGSAFYLTRNSLNSNEEPLKESAKVEEVVEEDSVEVRK